MYVSIKLILLHINQIYVFCFCQNIHTYILQFDGNIITLKICIILFGNLSKIINNIIFFAELFILGALGGSDIQFSRFENRNEEIQPISPFIPNSVTKESRLLEGITIEDKTGVAANNETK